MRNHSILYTIFAVNLNFLFLSLPILCLKFYVKANGSTSSTQKKCYLYSIKNYINWFLLTRINIVIYFEYQNI